MRACRPSCCRVSDGVCVCRARAALGCDGRGGVLRPAAPPQPGARVAGLARHATAAPPAGPYSIPETRPAPPLLPRSPAAPAGRPLPKVATPGRKMLRSGSAALQKLTQMVGRSRQVYKVTEIVL